MREPQHLKWIPGCWIPGCHGRHPVIADAPGPVAAAPGHRARPQTALRYRQPMTGSWRRIGPCAYSPKPQIVTNAGCPGPWNRATGPCQVPYSLVDGSLAASPEVIGLMYAELA